MSAGTVPMTLSDCHRVALQLASQMPHSAEERWVVLKELQQIVMQMDDRQRRDGNPLPAAPADGAHYLRLVARGDKD